MKKKELAKRLVCLLAALVLGCGTALASTYVNADIRIKYYYQYDGAEFNSSGVWVTDSPGKWDRLLASSLYKLCSHSEIYHDSSTSRYLTGRGCDLFAHAHAWQFLFGKAGSESEQTQILLNFLKKQPVWSKYNSSISPPAAQSMYNSVIMSQGGVTRYSQSSLDTWNELCTFFTGGKGCIISSGMGHYILAVGCTEYNGEKYVQIVDSVLHGTIQSGRIPMGWSMDFKTVYTPSNVWKYTPSVHQYWVKFSDYFSKCCYRVGYRVGALPDMPNPTVRKKTLTVPAGGSQSIVITNTPEDMTYTSSDTGVCTVSSAGVVTGVSAGTAQVVCKVDGSTRSVTVTVNVFKLPDTAVMVASPGEELTYPYALPYGLTAEMSVSSVYGYGLHNCTAAISDTYGDVVLTETVQVISPDPSVTIYAPDGLTELEDEAFAGVSAEYIVLPEAIETIGERAFAGSSAKVVVLNPDCEINPAVTEGSSVTVYQAK